MADPKWFDEDAYLANKLVQLQTIEPEKGWTPDLLQAELAKYSATPYQHFVAQGNSENISPNSYFNVAEYLKAKADQMNAMNDGQGYEGKTDWTEAAVQAEMAKYGVSAWDHYNQVGQYEGVNPSNALDTSAYFEDKAELLNAAKWEGRTDWTAADIQAIFKAAGCSPLTDPDQNLASIPAVPAEEQVTTSYNPYTPSTPGTPGETYELTTAVDTITGTVNDDTFNGVASSLTKEATLNAGDQLDGAAGNDTLNVTMNSNFTGFTGDGKLVNVENVNLTNAGTLARTFNAANISGVETYTLNAETAAINLSNLAAAGITVNVKDQASGATTIGFTTDAVKGTSDALTLGLKDVGTVGEGSAADKYVTPTVTGIENLTVKATGQNLVDLSGVADAKSITVTGAGTLDVNAVGSKVTSFDASAATGSVEADLGGSAALTAIKGGAGDDAFAVTKLAANATLEGGAGDDTLVLKGMSGTLQPTMSGFETVQINGTTGATLTLSAKNVQDLTGLELTGMSDVTLANLDATDFTVTGLGDGVGTTGAFLTLASAVNNLTINTEADEDKVEAKTAEVVKLGVTASAEAASATINVGEYTTTSGELTLSKLSGDLQVNVASGLDKDGKETTSFAGTVIANTATSLTVDADGTLGAAATFNVAKATSVTVDAANGGTAKIQAAAAKDVNITAGAAMALTGSDFAKAETVTLTQNAGALTGGVAFDAINTLTVSGEGTAEGKASAITVGNLGSATHGYDINVTATGLAGGFTFGAVKAGEGDVTLDLTEVTGNVNTPTTTAPTVDGNNITVNAAQLGTTNLGDITATGDVTIDGMGILGGSAAIDALHLGNISIAKDHSAAISFDGSSDVTIGTITGTGTGTSVTLDASGYLGAITAHVDAVDATIGAITAETVTIKGSEIAANDFATVGHSITADNLTFTGGLGNDKVDLTGLTDATGTTTTMNLSIDTGVGNDDDVTITATGATHMTGTIANAEEVTITAGTAALDMTGLTITGNTADDTTITGSDVIDTLVAAVGGGKITGGKEADNITLGAGVDTVNVAPGDSTTTDYDHITGFATTATGDILQLDSTSIATSVTGWTVSNGVATIDSGTATLTEFISAFATTTGVVAFAVGGNTYVLNSDGTDTTTDDVLVELVGVTGVTAVSTTAATNTIHIAA
ncbi:hypothetical protein [uncultured Desulfovibrio sp.]|uniref:beta strand repeat-containing protein n=1 Tax=uncultured Desulfovibrio sp. TaxID=167968 RepID=UPI00266CE704|nr:hypothetical protein [uncultured Desulfovibrio sp.]